MNAGIKHGASAVVAVYRESDWLELALHRICVPGGTPDRVEARPHVEQPQAYGSGGGGSSGTVRWVARRFSRSSFRTTSHGQYVRVYRPNTSTV